MTKGRSAAGQLELRFPIRVADCEPLLLTGDLSDDDLTTSGRLTAALAELLPDMVRHYASRLEEPHPRALSLYAFAFARTALGDATLADLELVRHYLQDQALERPLRGEGIRRFHRDYVGFSDK